VEYKCNLDCWYCWAYNNKVKGMTDDIARRSIDWLYDHGCHVLALMGGEPLRRPQFAHKVVYYAAKKGFWIYIGTNGRLLRPEVADRLGDAGVSVFNFAVDAWDEKPRSSEIVTVLMNTLSSSTDASHASTPAIRTRPRPKPGGTSTSLET
jgi:MoaA/NifB/PqqE/SkfB family radical SAM enzyme